MFIHTSASVPRLVPVYMPIHLPAHASVHASVHASIHRYETDCAGDGVYYIGMSIARVLAGRRRCRYRADIEPIQRRYETDCAGDGVYEHQYTIASAVKLKIADEHWYVRPVHMSTFVPVYISVHMPVNMSGPVQSNSK